MDLIVGDVKLLVVFSWVSLLFSIFYENERENKGGELWVVFELLKLVMFLFKIVFCLKFEFLWI